MGAVLAKIESFARLARRAAGITIIDMTNAKWRQALWGALEPPFSPGSPAQPYRGQDSFEAVLDTAKNDLGAVVAVVEKYVSTDWNDEYSALYSRTFMPVPKVSQRIHFFGKSEVSLGPTRLFKMPEQLKDAYLGYTVVRPLRGFRVGDTVLASPSTVSVPHQDLVHCHVSFSVSLLGNHLTVIGAPFIQQETTVGVCAEADLWMIARYLNQKGETRRFRPSEITAMALSTISIGPPREGLDEVQMVDALRQMGLNPVVFYPENPSKAKEFLYTCVESELPVIVALPEHVVLAIGHGYEDPLHFEEGRRWMSEAVNRFVLHDDASGPYRRWAIGKKGVNVAALGIAEQMTLDGKAVDYCLAVLPQRVNMNIEDVHDAATLWLAEIRGYAADMMGMPKSHFWSPDIPGDLVLRAYLRLSRDFKASLHEGEPDDQRAKGVVQRYLCMRMPKYVWVIELARRSDLEGKSPFERRIRGEILLDSTGNRHIAEETLLALHFEGIMFVPERDGLKADVVVGEKRTYLPLRRSTRKHGA